MVTACTVGPDVPAAERGRTAALQRDGPAGRSRSPKTRSLRGAWWELFQDPRLNALAELVDISNQTLAAAEAQVRQARAAIQAARAGYFPTLSVSADVTRARASANVANSKSTTLTQYTLPMDASWELDLWGRVRRTVESQRAAAQASVADLESLRLSAQTTLAQSYFALRIQDAQRQLLEATVATYQRSLAIVQNRYAVGVASRADVAQAETQLKSTQAQLVDVGVQRAQLEHAIAVLIGASASTFSIPFEPLTVAVPAIPVGVPSALLERRPDLAGAERRVAAANAQIGVAEAAFYPSSP